MYSKIITTFSLVFLFACSGKKEEIKQKPTNQPTLVDVMLASTKSISNNIEISGTSIANEMVQILPEISGRLTYLNVPDGANIAAGTILAKINDAEQQAQLNKSKVQLELATKTEERFKKLLNAGGINQADYDAALNTVNNIKADIELLKAQIDKTIIKAPFSGVLGLRQTSPGAYVTPQTPIATLQQVNKVKIDFTVPEMYASIIKKGLSVQVTANNSEMRRATVIATEPEINASTRNLKVRAVLENGIINPGTFVKVMIGTTGTIKNIVVPTNSIIPDATSKKVIVVKNGKGKFVNVETGLRTAGGIEVTKGLTIGDSVIVTGVLFVRPNSAVKVRSVKQLEEVTKENQ
ncbi:MAG: efflux RND transporter periplasmic adaptor subunit [Chitinophagaceae bacterium]|jgi:membrane fusion protein (multidrug efflux system)|nr:efflux RND transporter periplasmic adaptor subunit [Chitinophagaceae bacterium]